MYIIFIGILYLVARQSYSNKLPGPPMISDEDKDDCCLKEFFTKYCVETNETILRDLEKCEVLNPKEVEIIEDQCISEIRKEQGINGKPTLIEYRDLECDTKMSKKLEKCIDEKFNEQKMKELEKIYPKLQLDEKARAIKDCGCDVYKIKHD